MTQPDPTAAGTTVDRIPLAHSVRYVAHGLPEVPNKYGDGVLAPSEITLTYRAAPDSQLGRVHAYVAGRLWVNGVEVPLLGGGLYGQHYDDGLDGWPDWLAEEARLHDPDAVVSPPTDRAAIIAEVLPDWEAMYEPGNVSDYLIGYANDEHAAKGAAEAWMRSQAEVTGRLEWVSDDRLATGRYDRWFELVERHDDGVDTGPGIVVRRRLAVEAQPCRWEHPHPGYQCEPRTVVEAHDTGTQQPARCPHGCDVTRCPCLACEADEVGPDRCSGCRYVPCGNCAAPVAQQQPTDEDVVEAHRLALSEALHLGNGAPWDAILDRAADLSRRDVEALRRLAAEARAVPLATTCAYCGHRYDEHNRFGCCVGNEEVRCGCDAFVMGEKPAPVDPRTILGIDADAPAPVAQQPAAEEA